MFIDQPNPFDPSKDPPFDSVDYSPMMAIWEQHQWAGYHAAMVSAQSSSVPLLDEFPGSECNRCSDSKAEIVRQHNEIAQLRQEVRQLHREIQWRDQMEYTWPYPPEGWTDFDDTDLSPN